VLPLPHAEIAIPVNWNFPDSYNLRYELAGRIVILFVDCNGSLYSFKQLLEKISGHPKAAYQND